MGGVFAMNIGKEYGDPSLLEMVLEQERLMRKHTLMRRPVFTIMLGMNRSAALGRPRKRADRLNSGGGPSDGTGSPLTNSRFPPGRTSGERRDLRCPEGSFKSLISISILTITMVSGGRQSG